MALALRATAATGESFKRYAKTRVLELEKVLAEAADQGHGGVHKARRRLKALRSFLRMLRPAIGEDAFAESNVALRTAAHALAGARKAGAMIEAADKLATALGKDISAANASTLAAIRAAAEADAASHASEDQVTGGVGQALEQIRLVKRSVNDWRLPKRDTDFYVEGMRKVYASARKLLHQGLGSGDSIVLHEARKAVIHLRYHLETIEPIWPGLFKAWAKELQVLREVLGDINDLHDMETLIESGQSAFATMPEKEAALGLIDRRRQKLIEDARPLVSRLYAEKPSGFATRMSALWNSWVKQEHSSGA